MNFTFPRFGTSMTVSTTSSFEPPASGSVRSAPNTCWPGMKDKMLWGPDVVEAGHPYSLSSFDQACSNAVKLIPRDQRDKPPIRSMPMKSAIKNAADQLQRDRLIELVIRIMEQPKKP